MATAWDVASAGWAITVLGWLLSPIIALILPKILSFMGFDASQKLQDLKIQIIPELENTVHQVDQARMMQRGEKSHVSTLDEMAAWLRHARYEVDDIFDDEQEIKLYRNRFRQRLYGVVATCIARRKSSCVWISRIVYGTASVLATCTACFKRSSMWVACIVRSGPARLLQWVQKISLRGSEDVLPVTTGVAASEGPALVAGAASDELVSVTTSSAIFGPVPVATNATVSDELTVPVTVPSESSGRRLSFWCSSFELFKNGCRSIFYWLVHAIEAAHTYRDWSYDVVGITGYQENASTLDSVLTAISRWKLKKRIEKIGNTVSEVKKSPLLGAASNNTPGDIANKNRSRIRTASKRKVFGREVLRDDIMARLRKTPERDAASSSASPCYSVIGIYGVAGSGKTTFARYIRDYIEEECKEEKLFDTIMCIHVTETFSVDDIFHEMLKDITKDRHSNISDREELEEKLKESLCGKRFFLILDDLWMKNKNNLQLEELISPLNVGVEGSKVLVTARTKVAASALCFDEPIEMPNLDEDHYLSMFMHYALGGASDAHEDFIRVGREIAKKLHRSPIAAVIVAGQIGTNRDIKFWKSTANLDMLNDTMDALWWSYQQLNPDIRRCFEFCNIFPRRFKLEKDKLVRLWIAQGFLKASCATEDLEDVGLGYVQELVSCSFLQTEETSWPEDDCFRIHDLLHDLLEKVAGSDCFRIENKRGQRGEGWKGDVPRDVRHLFVEKYNAELIAEKVLGLENLRTLVIYVFEMYTRVEENVIESICMRLPKLRVLAIPFNKDNFEIGIGNPNDTYFVLESIIQLKHLRYLAFPKRSKCKVILPCALAKLVHIQLLDFGNANISDFSFADLINLRQIFYSYVYMNFRNIGRLTSLQTIPRFEVSYEQGSEIKQLRDLNKIRGTLLICGLENVKSKEDALEANLAAKERLTELTLSFYCYNYQRSAEVNAEVLEGLCPPVGLETLKITNYGGSRYPDWMVGKQNGGPKDLQKLDFTRWKQQGPGPELEAFPHLRVLELMECSWDALPGNMEHLTLLKKLTISRCMSIRSLPTLPQSLKKFCLFFCDDELMKGCQTKGHPNWHKVKHIRRKGFCPRITSSTSSEASEAHSGFQAYASGALSAFSEPAGGSWFTT